MYENIPSQLWIQFVEIKEISGNWCQKSAVNYQIKLVNPDHKISIKISYLIDFCLLLFLHYL